MYAGFEESWRRTRMYRYLIDDWPSSIGAEAVSHRYIDSLGVGLGLHPERTTNTRHDLSGTIVGAGDRTIVLQLVDDHICTSLHSCKNLGHIVGKQPLKRRFMLAGLLPKL